MPLTSDHRFYNALTSNQIALIQLIEESIGVEFTGCSYLETNAFIKKYRGHPDLPVTESQRKAIGTIESVLRIEFIGVSYKQAYNFIAQHISKSMEVQEKARRLTHNQKNIIPHIERVLDVKFKGSTKIEGVSFIGDYLDAFKLKNAEINKELRANGVKKD